MDGRAAGITTKCILGRNRVRSCRAFLASGELITRPSADTPPPGIPQDHFHADNPTGPRHFGPALVDLRGGFALAAILPPEIDGSEYNSLRGRVLRFTYAAQESLD